MTNSRNPVPPLNGKLIKCKSHIHNKRNMHKLKKKLKHEINNNLERSPRNCSNVTTVAVPQSINIETNSASIYK